MRYIKPTSDTIWPNPTDPSDLEWTLRYGMPTQEDLYLAASYIAAYRTLFDKTQKDLIKTVSKIKMAAMEVN